MAVLRKSPWYNEIVKKGLLTGRQEEAAALVIRQLTRRFGELLEGQVAQLRQLSVPQLESLGEALLDFAEMADLEQFLAGGV